MTGGELDLGAIVRALNDQGVEYVVIGAVALAGHGHVRGTTDVDVVPSPRLGNLERLVAALEALGARPWLPPGFPADSAPRRLDAALLDTGRNFAFVTPLGELDVMQDVPGAPPYEELRRDAVEAEVGPGLTVRICSRRHLVAMKAASGRPQDKVDLGELGRPEGERGAP